MATWRRAVHLATAVLALSWVFTPSIATAGAGGEHAVQQPAVSSAAFDPVAATEAYLGTVPPTQRAHGAIGGIADVAGLPLLALRWKAEHLR
jgi:hypothetical protein